jgi:phospholipid N-methyltransferase
MSSAQFACSFARTITLCGRPGEPTGMRGSSPTRMSSAPGAVFAWAGPQEARLRLVSIRNRSLGPATRTGWPAAWPPAPLGRSRPAEHLRNHRGRNAGRAANKALHPAGLAATSPDRLLELRGKLTPHALPQAPNIIASRQSGLTFTPVPPSVRYSTPEPQPTVPHAAQRDALSYLDAEASHGSGRAPSARKARATETDAAHGDQVKRQIERERISEGPPTRPCVSWCTKESLVQRLEHARLTAHRLIGPSTVRTNRLLGRAVYRRGYFELRYRKRDPWNYLTSDYERERHQRMLTWCRVLEPRRILELGCAEGVFTAALAAFNGEVVAIDISARAVARARERCADFPRAQIVQVDVRREIPAGQFDLIVCTELLYYLEPRTLQSMRDRLVEQLAPGGSLLLVHGWPQAELFHHQVFAASPALTTVQSELVSENPRPYAMALFRRLR